MMNNDWARPVVYFEIQARDAETLSLFYKELFNWSIGDGFIKQIPAGIGGPENGIGGHMRTGNKPGVTLFIQVKNLEQTQQRATDLGGKITSERFDIPGGASIVGIEDPEGNAITLVQQ